MIAKDPKRITRRDMRREATKAAVLSAARTVFLTHGYEAATIKEIARQADVSPGTVMNAEPSKASLLIAVLFSEYEDMKEQAEQLLESVQASVPEKIDILLQQMFDAHARHPELFGAILGYIWLSDDEGYRQAYDNMKFAWQPLRDLIEQGQETGALRNQVSCDVLFEACLDIFCGSLKGLITNSDSDPRGSLSARLSILMDGARA